MGDPHVLLAYAEAHPQVSVGRRAVALLDAARILRTEGLVVARIAHGGHIAVDEVERGVLQSVTAQRDGKRPAVLRRVVDGGVRAVAQPLSPNLGVAVHKALRTEHGLRPGVAAVRTDRGQRMLPQRGNLAVRQGVPVEGLVRLVERDERFIAVRLLHPLHAIERIGKDFLTCLPERLVLGFRIEGVGSLVLAALLRVEVVVQIDEIDGSERAVRLDFAHDTADAVAVVRVVLLLVQADAVVAHGYQFARLGDVEAHTLVHDSLRPLLCHIRQVGLAEPFGHLIGREQLHGVGPGIAVGGSLEEGDRGRHMLVDRVGQVVHVEASVPVRHHRLVVVRPAIAVRGGRLLAVGTHGLYVVHTHHGRQPSVMRVRVG